MNMVINPGSGPVEGAIEEQAIENIAHWIVDCNIEGLEWIRLSQHDEDGRFGFMVYKSRYGNFGPYMGHLVEMPGIPLERVRYMNEEQNIWDFPRLYIDGSSWVWSFSLLDEESFEFKEED